jgi:hypothetical protein
MHQRCYIQGAASSSPYLHELHWNQATVRSALARSGLDSLGEQAPRAHHSPHESVMFLGSMQALHRLPTSTREDLALLDELGASRGTGVCELGRAQTDMDCKKLALQWRISYKRALARAYRLAEAFVAQNE